MALLNGWKESNVEVIVRDGNKMRGCKASVVCCAETMVRALAV
jgi:hypothetical protein